jgi:hypothetical protein
VLNLFGHGIIEMYFVKPSIVLMRWKMLKRGSFVYPPTLPPFPFNIFVVKIHYIFATTRFDLWMFKGAHDIFVFEI